MGHHFLFLPLFDADNLRVERILSRAVNAGQTTQGNSCFEIVCSLQHVGKESVKHQAENGSVRSMRILLQREGTRPQLGIDGKQNGILCFFEI